MSIKAQHVQWNPIYINILMGKLIEENDVQNLFVYLKTFVE